MQPSSQGGGGGGMGGSTAASLQEMQRLQQQLQAQYQQAQAQQQLQHQQQNNNASASLGAGGGGGSSTGGVMQFGSLAQQQAVQRAAGGAPAGVAGAGSGMMRNTTALAMMQQHAGGNANPSVSNSSSVSSLYGNLAALQQQQQQQHQGTTNMLTSAGNSLMDASSGSSARLMAMAGMGMTSNMNQHHHQMQSSSNDLNNNNNSTSSNMSISSSGNNNNNNNHMMMDSAAAMQSMQALFQQQQQAAAMGHASQQIPQQQQAAAAAQAAAAQMFAAAARRSSLGSSMGSLGGGGGGGGNASTSGAPISSSQLMGHGGAPQNMQQLMLQQQLSTLQQHMQASHQQQQLQQQTLPGSGNNSVVGGSSSSAGVVQQQSGLVPSAAAVAAAMGLQGANAAAAASLMSASSSSSQGGSAANLLQARQQQLMQQIQQQQRAAAAANASAPGGIMRQTSNPLAQLQQNAAAAAAAASIGGAGGGSRGPATAASLALQAQSVALGTALGRGQLNEQQLRLYQQNLLRSSADAASMGADAARVVARSSSIHSPAGSEHHSVVQQQQQMQQQQHLRDVFGNTQSEMDSSTSTRLMAPQLQQQHSANQHHSNRLAGTPSLMADSSARSLHNISTANPHHQQQKQHHQQQQHSSGPVTAMGVPMENSMIDGQHHQQQQHAGQQAKNFLDGNFAGGWQSNDDLPDRRKVIFSILEVIRQMRPDASDMSSNRLPRMAKSLEEHLYRSAPTKEQYLDMKTLKRRLQSVASGLDIHRTSSGTSLDGAAAAATNSHSVRSSSFGQQQQNAQWGNQNQPAAVAAHVAPSSNRNSSGGGVALTNSAPDMNGSHHGTISPSLSMLQQQHQQHQQSRRSILQSQQGGMIDSSALSQAPQLGSWNNNNQGAVATQQIGSSQHGGVAAASSQQQQSDSSQDFLASQASFLSSSSTASTAWDRTQSLLANALGGSSSSGTSSKVINPDYPNTPKYQDPDAAQKKKVIMQQQQRLLLLRHASKCKAGPTCSTKFCNQMVTLWRHMKTCRDKNCKTSHCLSSRCVLNHYRICKSQGKTATCEVCGPVMSIIRLQGRDDGSNDPLARDPQAPTPSSQPQMGDHSQMSSLATLMASQQQAAQAQLTSSGGSDAQRQQHAVAMMAAASQQMLGGNSTLGGMSNGVGSNGSVASLQDNSEQSQLQQLQQHQMKMQSQLESLKELQKQQQQLLDQQNRLQEQSELIVDPDSPGAQELQQQQMLLDELQKRCQQQQLRLQQEIEVQANSVSVSQSQQTQAQQTQLQHQLQLQQQQQFQQAQLQAQQQAQQQFQQAQQQQAEAQDATQPERVQAQDVAAVTSNSLTTGEPSEPVKKKRSRSTSEGKPRRVGKGERSGKGKSLKISQARKAAAAEASVKRKSSVVAAVPKERVKKPKLPPQSEIPIPSAEDQNSSLVSFMTKENIESHLESLDKKIHMTNRTVTHKCLPIAQQLIDDKFGWVFHDAVDPVALGLPDYYEVIKTPMCLSLVKKKLENAIYPSMDLFARDIRLVFENAILYNGEVSEVGELAQSLLDKFAIMYKDLVEGVESSQQQLEIKGEACSLCGSQKRKFEPTVLYCQGKCGMQRIKRGATYYTERTKANHWCDACYELIDPEDPIILDDGSEIQKKDLQEFKNDALPEEAWVNCDGCGSWVHQICALFNGRTNKSNAKYTCPHCYLRKGEEIGFPIAEKKFDKGAEDLPSSKMSTAIESGVQEALGKAYALRAKELGVSLDEVEKADGLTVRVVSNVEKKQLIGGEMFGRYSSQGCPSELPVHSKCIGLFQKIHGADMLLFALYVYEYGQECPAPNKRRVYISYLDSVQYFEPKIYRTTAYQAILVEYLRYVKTRGFHTAHIWSCPPAPGDDYIFYCHPSHQMTPREDMLRTWYHEMLDKAKAQGIVIRSTTLYDEYFANDGVDKAPGPRDDPTCLPYFEGDYIPGEIETIIRHLRADNRKTDSTGDEVMNRLRHNIGKMKDNFIVVHLRNRRFAAAVERGEDVSKWTEDSDEELIRSKRAKISGKDSGSIAVDKEGDGSEDTKTVEPSASEGQAGAEPDAVKCNASEIAAAVSGHLASLDRKPAVVADTADEDPTIESEMFESRQQFLNYCQTNHCQFDELRRAKHSTMMVMFQLHNPSAPKFLQQCNACYRDMTHGYRYHCNNCSNFDLCEDCYKPVTTGLWAQRDERFAHDASHTFTPIDMEATEENQKSPAERQKALKDHISLLEHAGTCPGPPQCSLQNCERMKKLFEHVRGCEIKPKTGCKICTRLLSLCFMHARMCPIRGQCPIPFCDRIRERNLRVRRQQQLMDDRRRQAQNELYHAGGATSSSC